jgi:hypothetical protein
MKIMEKRGKDKMRAQGRFLREAAWIKEKKVTKFKKSLLKELGL